MKYNVKSNWSLREWNVDGVVKLNNPAHMALDLPRANFSELLRAITPVKMSSSVYLGKSGLIRPLTGKIINSNKALQTHTLAHTHAHIRIHTHTHSPQYTRARTRVCSRATHIHTQNRIRGKVWAPLWASSPSEKTGLKFYLGIADWKVYGEILCAW